MHKKNSRRLLGIVAAGLIAAFLSGCGGDDGSTGPQGPSGPPGAEGPPGPAGPPSSGNVNVATISPEAWESANFKSEVTSVSISSPPVVSFTVSDAQGNPVVGLETVTSKSASATVAQYPNVSFALAKLMPRTDTSPSEWVSYIVTTVPTTSSPNAAPTRPSTDNTGTLEAVAGTPGAYKYTFYRDVPGVKAAVAAMAASAAAASPNNRVADLGDLTYEPNLPHRLTIQIGGAAPGTGSNTANAVQVTAAVNAANPVNVTYDFIPATGKVLTPAELTREDVNIDSCNVCHGKLAFHGGSARVETRYCVVCHTEQRAYGQPKAVSVAGKFPALTETATVNPTTGITSFSYSPSTYIADGEVAGNFNTLIHKIHNGTWLVKENYHYAGLAFNNKGFSKLGGGQRMCTTCHDNKIASTADNYKNLPSRQACGACHDGIDWATGTGSTLADRQATTAVGAVVPTSGHIGRGQADDSRCALCHTPDYVKLDHQMENITKNNPVITEGLATFTYDIKSVTVNSTSNDVTIEFGIKQRLAPSTTDALVTLAPAAPSVTAPLAGFTGGPSFLLAYAMPQDGITTPVDYNNLGRPSAQPRSVSIAQLLSTSNAANGTLVPSATTTGYYKATIFGAGAWAFPVGAKLRATALQGYFTQVSGPAAPPAAPVARHAISVVKAVSGDTVRRTVVDAEKCSNCHEWFEGHGGNRVKETQVCVTCHVPGLATSGRGIPDSLLNTWTFDAASTRILTDWRFDKTLPNAALNFPTTTNNFKDMIHGIHAGRDRVSPFQDARDRSSSGVIQLLDFRRMDFPGVLKNCETCHVTATRDEATFNVVPNNTLLSTYESIDAAYAAGIASGTATPALAKASLATANVTDTVTTPFAAACISCHDNAATRAHVTINGGVVKAPRSTAIGDIESCAVCHGPGRSSDTAVVHK